MGYNEEKIIRVKVSARDQTDSTDMSYSEMHYLLHALGIEE